MSKMRIYGDSILRGVTYSEEKSRYTLWTGHNLDNIARLGIDIENHSRMGATIAKGYDELLKSLVDCEEGSIVLLEFGGNDCDYKWSEISDNPGGTFLPNTPKELFLDTYRSAIRYALSKGAQVVLCTLVPLSADKYMNWISKGLSFENILTWLGDKSMLYRWQEHYSAMINSLAAEFSLPVIDLREKFLLSHRYNYLLAADGIHPTEEGHRLVESSIFEFLTNASNDIRFDRKRLRA